MKSLRKASAILFLGFSLVVLGACAKDDSAAVKSYNNSIVQIQKDMLNQASQESTVFTRPDINSKLIADTLQRIQREIMASYQSFEAIAVPPGASDLSISMGKFFQVEKSGIQDVLYGISNIQSHPSDPTAVKIFNDVFQQFSNQENQALRDFYNTQQSVAGRYNQKLVDTGN